METIKEMIARMCPKGVEKVKLADIGTSYTGLSGKAKEDFIDGNALFVTYSNIFNNPSLNLNIKDKVRINEGEKQNEVIYGDILFTGSSETPDEAGMSSVVLENPKEKMYLNSFCFGYRLNDFSQADPNFMCYILRDRRIRKDISKTAFGVTRFNINKERFFEIEIPLPPLPIQQEIVRILDSFTSLQSNLEAELIARQKQYEHYRNVLLTFDKNDKSVEWKPIGEIGKLVRGNGLQKTDFTEDGIGCIHYGQIYTRLGFSCEKTLTFVNPYLAKSLTKVEPGDIVMACTSENVEDVCKSVVWLGNETIVTGGHACVFKHKENPKYIGYCLLTNDFFNQKRAYAYGAKVIDIKTEKLALIQLPIPSLQRQQEIVNILDTFEATIANLKQEIEARKKQYEYYREQLLTFN